MIKYGELIKLCRQSKNMKQKELAERAHITPSLLSAYETGKKMPRLDMFSDLIEICGYEIGIREKKTTYTAEELVKFMEENR